MANISDYFKGKIVLITGGTSGIGLSLVRAFHTRGALVRFCARTEAAVRQVERSWDPLESTCRHASLSIL